MKFVSARTRNTTPLIANMVFKAFMVDLAFRSFATMGSRLPYVL
ncbi:MAG: hypothetical protein WBO21_00555 [Acidimicrobiia bacterium]